MTTQPLSTPTLPTQFTSNVSLPISPGAGNQPLTAPQIPQPLSSGTNQHKSRSLIKIGIFIFLLFVLVGGIGVAFFLNTQTQEIRQQADEIPEPTPPAFTYHAPVSGTSVLSRSDNGEVDTIVASIEFDNSPSCLNGACRANVRVVPDKFPDLGSEIRCRINTATVVYYNMQTKTDDGVYPANVALPAGGANANCARPLTYCADGSDPNCERGNFMAYGPPTSQCGGDPYACRYFVAEIPFSLRSIDQSCGCSQLDVSVSNISFSCDGDTQTITYTKEEGDTSVGGYAYGYSTAQCSANPPTNTPAPPTNTPTPPINTPTPTPPVVNSPTPTSPPNSTPTPTPAIAGPMCASISMNPTSPKLNDQVTFTCGKVTGITEYQFRYFEPGSSTPISLSAANANVSSPLTLTKTGNYRAQCRICPSNADRNDSCANPNWGWDPVPTP